MRTRGQMKAVISAVSGEEDMSSDDRNASGIADQAGTLGLLRRRLVKPSADDIRGSRRRVTADTLVDEDAIYEDMVTDSHPADRSSALAPKDAVSNRTRRVYPGEFLEDDDPSISSLMTCSENIIASGNRPGSSMNPGASTAASFNPGVSRIPESTNSRQDFVSSAATIISDTYNNAIGSFSNKRPPRRRADTNDTHNIFATLTDMADHYVSQFPVVMKIAEPLGMRPVHVPILTVAVLLLLMGVFDNLISNCVGFFYPAWQSFKAVESPSHDDDRQWLTYWVVYAFFSFMEIFGDYLLAWVPFYYLIKVLFLLWLFLPQTKGASVIYANFVRPFLLRYESRIDNAIDCMAHSSQKLLTSTVVATTVQPQTQQQMFSSSTTAKLKRAVFGRNF